MKKFKNIVVWKELLNKNVKSITRYLKLIIWKIGGNKMIMNGGIASIRLRR